MKKSGCFVNECVIRMSGRGRKTRRELLEDCFKKLTLAYIDRVWSEYRSRMIHEFRGLGGLLSGEEIEIELLAHWLVYILDFQIKARDIWDCNGMFCYMRDVVSTYRKNGLKDGIIKLLDMISQHKIWHRYLLSKPHFLLDKIISTLIVLEKFNRSIFYYIIYYLGESLNRIRQYTSKYQLRLKIRDAEKFFEDNWIRILAHGLYVLTYIWPLTLYKSISERYEEKIRELKQVRYNDSDINNLIESIIKGYRKIINDLFSEEIENSLSIKGLLSMNFCYDTGCECDFKHKRVWSAVKDYVCYDRWRKNIAKRLSEIIDELVKNVSSIPFFKSVDRSKFLEVAEKLLEFSNKDYYTFEKMYLEQVELPGDQRNVDGLRKDFGLCEEMDKIIFDGNSAREFVRLLFNEFRDYMKKKGYYPIYADYTFYREG